jgi:hypothetical protein
MKTLWFVSAFVFILTSCNNFICRKVQTENTANQRVIPWFLDTLNVRKFKTSINFKTTELSGILIYKKMNESTSAGSFINEFGLKGFDFSVTQSRARLGYIFRNLDKRYVRRTLETDLHFIFSKPILLTDCLINDTPAFIAAISSSLHYVYYIADNKDIERAEMYKRARKISILKQYYDKSAGLVLKMEHNDGSLSYEFSEIKN